jgi:hypothetical protein
MSPTQKSISRVRRRSRTCGPVGRGPSWGKGATLVRNLRFHKSGCSGDLEFAVLSVVVPPEAARRESRTRSDQSGCGGKRQASWQVMWQVMWQAMWQVMWQAMWQAINSRDG